MAKRIDSASRLIAASPMKIYLAFAEPGAMEKWLPPGNMTGKMLLFDFREGGSYRMRLTYKVPQPGPGKTSADSDECKVRLSKIEIGKRIEQDVVFESDDPVFAGIMQMVWTFDPKDEGTLVTICAENVPVGISAKNHEVGLNASLENLASFVELKHT